MILYNFMNPFLSFVLLIKNMKTVFTNKFNKTLKIQFLLQLVRSVVGHVYGKERRSITMPLKPKQHS